MAQKTSSKKIEEMLKDISVLKEIIIADIEVIEQKDFIIILNRVMALLNSLKKNKPKAKIVKSKIGKDYSIIPSSLMYRKLNDGDIISLYANDKKFISSEGRFVESVKRVFVRFDKPNDALVGILDGKFYQAASDVYTLIKEVLPKKRKNKAVYKSSSRHQLKLKL